MPVYTTYQPPSPNHVTAFKTYQTLKEIASIVLALNLFTTLIHTCIPDMDVFISNLMVSAIGLSLLHSRTRSQLLNTIDPISRYIYLPVLIDSYFIWTNLVTVLDTVDVLKPNTQKLAILKFIYPLVIATPTLFCFCFVFTKNPYKKNLWLKKEVNGFLESFLSTYQTTQSRFSIPAQRAVRRLNTMIKVYESNLRSEPVRTMFLLSDHLNIAYFLSDFFRHSIIETVFSIVSMYSKHTSQHSILFYRKHLLNSIVIARIPCALFLLKFINHHNWIRSICDQIGYEIHRNVHGSRVFRPLIQSNRYASSSDEESIEDLENGNDNTTQLVSSFDFCIPEAIRLCDGDSVDVEDLPEAYAIMPAIAQDRRR